MKKKKPSPKKNSATKKPVRKVASATTRGSVAVKSVMMAAQDSWTIVVIETTTVSIRRGTNYRLPLDFSQAPNGAGQFDSAMYLTTLTAADCPNAVIQEEVNYKTEQRCAWTIYVPDDGYQTTITVSLSGQMRGTGWTGGASVDGLWGTPEAVF